MPWLNESPTFKIKSVGIPSTNLPAGLTTSDRSSKPPDWKDDGPGEDPGAVVFHPLASRQSAVVPAITRFEKTIFLGLLVLNVRFNTSACPGTIKPEGPRGIERYGLGGKKRLVTPV
jgi:hypothetical protein